LEERGRCKRKAHPEAQGHQELANEQFSVMEAEAIAFNV